MKRIVLIIAISILFALTFGCAQQKEEKIDLQNMSAAEILGKFIDAGYPVYEQAVITKETDPSKLLGTPHGYTSKAEWMDRRASGLNNGGAFVEVFKNSADCDARKDELYQRYASLSSVRYSIFQEGKVLLSLLCDLTTGQVAEYEAAFEAMAQGNLPEPYTEGTRVNDYKDNQASAIEEAKMIAAMPGIFINKTEIGNVEGVPVYKEELELVAARMKSLDKENPYKDAMQRLKVYKHYVKLAVEYGITISDKEMSDYIAEQRDMFDNAPDPEVQSFMKDYCSALQMTEDEYWAIYKPIEAKRLFLKSKVDVYMETKGIDDISSDDIEYMIEDATYRDKIEGQ